MGVRKYYYTADDLVKKDRQLNEVQRKAKKDELVRTFRRILEQLGFTTEMIDWFRSGQNDVQSGRSGYFIFAGEDKEEVQKKLNEVFEKADQRPTYENMCAVINNLKDLLPFTKNEYWLRNLPNEQMSEFTKLVSLVDEISELKIYNEYKGNARINDELDKISRNICKIKNSKTIIIENLKKASAREEFEDYNDKTRRLHEIVVVSFLKRMNNTYFSDMKIASKEEFYRMIKNWCAVWIYLFENIDDLRKAEDFYNICKLLDHYKKDENYKKQFFREKWQMEGKMREAYAKFQKLPIILLPEYYLRYYKEKLVEMIRDSSRKEILKKEFSNSSNYLEECNAFVQSVGQWKDGGSCKEDVTSMKVEALRELDMIIEFIQSDAANIENEDNNETITDEEDKGDREKFVADYNKYKGTAPVSRECLECIFDLKYENEGLITDYLPYAKEILKDFNGKTIKE